MSIIQLLTETCNEALNKNQKLFIYVRVGMGYELLPCGIL